MIIIFTCSIYSSYKFEENPRKSEQPSFKTQIDQNVYNVTFKLKKTDETIAKKKVKEIIIQQLGN